MSNDNESQDSDTVIEEHSPRYNKSKHRSGHESKYENKEYKHKDDDCSSRNKRERSRDQNHRNSSKYSSRHHHSSYHSSHHSRYSPRYSKHLSRQESKNHSRDDSQHCSRHESKHRSSHDLKDSLRRESNHRSRHDSHNKSKSREPIRQSNLVSPPRQQKNPNEPLISTIVQAKQEPKKEAFDLKKKIEEMTKPVNDIAPISNTDKSKRDRELYVMNLPSGISPTDIMELLNTALISIEANTKSGKPIISAWVNTNDEFTLLEFRSPEESVNALKLNGMQLLNKPIKIGKPMYADEMTNKQTRDMFPTLSSFEKDLNNPYINKGASKSVVQAGISLHTPATSKLLASNIPTYYNEEHIKKVFKVFGKLKGLELIKDPITGTSSGQCQLEYETEKETQEALRHVMGLKLGDNILYIKRSVGIIPTYSNQNQNNKTHGLVSNSIPAISSEDFIKYRETQPSKIICIKNMVTLKELEDSNEYEDFYDDVIEECKNYGKVIQVKIPRPDGEYGVTGIGKVFVEYANRDGAAWAKKQLNGNNCRGKIVEVVFHPEELFKKDQLD